MSQSRSRFTTMLVPLDGSERAEHALPTAAKLAHATHTPLLLARVIPITSSAELLAAEGVYTEPGVYQELNDEREREAAAYLEQQAAPLRQRQVDVLARTCVRSGDVAGCLIDIEREEQVGLVVMTTHGRTGLARFALGSVADYLVRKGQAPVLSLRTCASRGEAESRLTRAVVPLDGSARAERALAVSLHLAGQVIEQAHVVRVVEMPDDVDQIAEAHRYLEGIITYWGPIFAERGCDLITRIRIGEPAEQVAQQATVDNAMIVLGTHGRSAAARWAFGSVADKLLQRMEAPLLLVRTGSLAV